MPSSLYSTAAGLMRSSAASRSSPGEASIGCTGRSSSSEIPRSPSAPSASASAATAPRSPRSITARWTSALGRSAAFATASVITPASAPWPMSPSSSAVRNRCSSSVARASSSRTASRRAVCEPAPLSAPTRVNVSSTSRHGQRRLGGGSRRVAQGGPADADLPLGQHARQPGDGRRRLGRLEPAQEVGEHRDFAAARRRVADGGRRLDELAQQHPRIVPPSAAVPSESYPQGLFVPPPDATELILVRHGASADAVPGESFELIEGQSNPPLSPAGEAQARAVAERLAPEPAAGLFISTLGRTAQTAAPLAALTGLEPVVLPDLREVHVGEFEGGRFRIALAERDPVFVRLLRGAALGGRSPAPSRPRRWPRACGRRPTRWRRPSGRAPRPSSSPTAG